ncbi:MAG: hypothetical protein ACM3ZO_08205 [Clostridia bacterium]
MWHALAGLIRGRTRRAHASAATARGCGADSRELRASPQPVPDTGLASPVESETRWVAAASRQETASGLGSGPVTLDDIRVALGPFDMSMRRWFTSVVPHEASIFIPHAELRMRRSRGLEEAELILDSITIVHAPSHRHEKPGRAAESRE